MDQSNLGTQIGATTVAALKLLPGFDKVLGLVEDLNQIWISDPLRYRQQISREAALLKNVVALIGRAREEIERNLTEKLASVEKLFGDLSSRVMTERRNNSVLISHVVGRILNYAISPDEDSFEELMFAAHNLSDLEFRILISLSSADHVLDLSVTHFSVGTFFDSKRFVANKREIAYSLSNLCDYGFFERIYRENRDDGWPERLYAVAPDVEEFLENIKSIETIAVLPNLFYVHNAARKVDSEEKARIWAELRAHSKEQLSSMPDFYASIVRRHPFDGYQWRVVRTPEVRGLIVPHATDWQGRDWQYESSGDAIGAANKLLAEDGHPIDWYYVSV